MAKFKYIDDDYYRRADETVSTLIVNDSTVVYLHYQNGYYSYFVGLSNLMKYLENGDTSGRLFCSDNTEDFENMALLFEK